MDRTLWFSWALGLAVGSSAWGVHGEDWPQWRGVDRTGRVAAGASVPDSLPAEPKIVWRIAVGEGFASPVVAAGKVFYFDNQKGQEMLHAVGAADAKEIWRTAVDSTFQDEQGPPGPRCTPVVDGGFIYAQSGKGELACLNVAHGERVWRVNFLHDFGSAFLGEDSKVPGAAEHGYTAAPLVVGDRLIACVGGTNTSGIVCFGKNNGGVLWKSQDDLASYAAPVLARLAGVTQAVCFTVDGVIGLNPEDGRLLWRIPLKTPSGRNCATPVIVDDWVVVGSYRAGLVGIKVTKEGEVLTAQQKWVTKEASVNFSSPVGVGGYIYGLGPTRNLFCVDAKTGRVAWSKTGYVLSSADVAHASFLAMREKILVCTDTGELVLLRADSNECQDLGRVQVCGKNWCNPAYADGRLYIRDGIQGAGHLFCIELTEGLR
jgi:outer membrane protein assembly factor BamB